jgi:ribosomal protein S3
MMLNRYKYNAIFIKDFIHLASITILLKNPVPLVKFIAYQFKRLPKNRKQFKLLKFLNQSLYIFCKQRHEIVGFKFQITGRLNRRRRTHKWVFQKGILSLQTQKTRVEYAYSEGFTRRGLIGIHF